MSVKIMSLVFEYYPTGGGEMLLALSLADFAGDDGGRIYPSVPTLARKTRQSERSIQYQLRKMEQSGFLEVVERSRGGLVRGKKYKSNEYRINTGFLVNGAKTAPLNQRCNPEQPTVQPITANGAIAVAPNPPYNPSLEPPRARDESDRELIFPSALAQDERNDIERVMKRVQRSSLERQQALLDELTGAIKNNSIRKGAVPYLIKLVNLELQGKFTPCSGVAVKVCRTKFEETKSVILKRDISCRHQADGAVSEYGLRLLPKNLQDRVRQIQEDTGRYHSKTPPQLG